MADEVGPEEQTGGMGRRDFLQKSAVVGGLVWAAPLVQSLGSPAFGQELPSPEIVFDCESVFRFKWEADNGFVDCGVGNEASCPNPAYSNPELDADCVQATSDKNVALIPGSNPARYLTATIIDPKTVRFSLGTQCLIQEYSIKAGNMGCIDVTVSNGGANSVVVSVADMTDSRAISNVTGVLCCDLSGQ